MINGIDEKNERRAREMEDEFDAIVKRCGECPPDINKIAASIESGLKNGNNNLKKFLAKGLYEKGDIDGAIEMLKDVPIDDDVRELHRALRYADESRGIVSNIDPETEKYFEDLANRLRPTGVGAAH